MSDSEDDGINLFEDPEGYYKPEKQPTFVTHKLLDGRELNLRLVGHNPLWGHLLWNAGRVFAAYLEENSSIIASKTVLELGAGAGLPSLISAVHGASYVLMTDYPDTELVENMSHNIDNCSLLSSSTSSSSSSSSSTTRNIEAKGYLWGADVQPLLSGLPESNNKEEQEEEKGFDVLILADLLFNHSEHAKLLHSIQQTLKKTKEARALVVFTPYRPWLLEADLNFFEIAKEGGFVVEKIFEKVMEKVMFEEDRGDELVRRTVFGYELRWKDI